MTLKLHVTLIFLFFSLFVFGQKINQQIETFLDTLDATNFSGAILVAHKDEVIHKKAFGLASIEYAAKNTVDTKFNLASITKMFTSVAVLQLYEKDWLV